MTKKVLVTGGAGFIGSHIVKLLLNKGYEVVVVDNLTTGQFENISSFNVPFYKTDIVSSELKDIFSKEKPNYVIHHAAQVDVTKSINLPTYDAETNIIGTINLLSCCCQYDVDKIIYASSCAVYGYTGDSPITEDFPIQPISFYGISKSVPEMYIRQFHDFYGLKYTIFRYANVYGPRQTSKGEGGVISIFTTKALKREQPIIYGNGEQTRDFIYVEDIAKANALALDKGDNEIFNIGTNQKTSINELYNKVNVLRPFAHSAKYSSPREGDILHSRLSYVKAKKILGWKPSVSLERGIQETLKYYEQKI